MTKLSAARIRANKKWDEKNKSRKAYISKRSAAKSFILKLATDDDLKTIEGYIAERRKMLNQQKWRKGIFHLITWFLKHNVELKFYWLKILILRKSIESPHLHMRGEQWTWSPISTKYQILGNGLLSKKW